MKFTTDTLITDLKRMIQKHIKEAEELKMLPINILNKQPHGKWSALQCLEHLNLYGDFYLHEVEYRITTSKYNTPKKTFKTGILGNYFAESMLPKEEMKPMETFADKNPNANILDKWVINRFIEQQNHWVRLLDLSKTIDIQKTKNNISISKLIRLRLGDTFRFVVNHNERHMVQAKRVIKNIPLTTGS